MTGDSERLKRIYNRPGLSQLAYRIGDYASFRQRLLAALPKALQPSVGRKGESPLAKLTTRDEADPAIALLDAWAVVADVLTFYQERIANEGFLRTATERRSVLELARAIGYELAPGVAASAYLSFKVEDAPGSPTVVPIPKRTQIMSVPAKDELPQIFETTEDFTAYLEWNGLRPQPNRPQQIYADTHQLYLSGTSTQLQPGDLLLLVDNSLERQEFLLLLQTVTINTDASYTLVQWNQSLPTITTPLRRPQLFAFRQQARLFGYNAPDWEIMPAEVKLTAVEKSDGAIQGGVFRSDSDGLIWIPASRGLPNSDILCLAARDNLLLAGTPDKGAFRSTDNGNTWEAANEGITSMNVLALHIADKDTVFNEAIFAGTPNGGVFRSKDQGKNWVAINIGKVRTRRIQPPPPGDPEAWEPVNTSLPNTVVRSLLTYTSTTSQRIGLVSSTGNTVNSSEESSEFTQIFAEDNTVIALDQRRSITSVIDDNSFRIDRPFIIENLPESTAFSARVTVSFELPSEDVQSETRTIDAGTISSEGNEVQGQDTEFLQLLDFLEEVRAREGVSNAEIVSIEITAMEQILTVAQDEERNFQIPSDINLTTTAPFTRNNLDSGTELFLLGDEKNIILVGTDEGVYHSTDQGQIWKPEDPTTTSPTVDRTVYALEYISNSNRVVAGTDRGIFTSSANVEGWLRVWNIVPISTRKVFSLAHYDDWLFAGTHQGVYRLETSSPSPSWEAINGNLPDDDPSSLAQKNCAVFGDLRARWNSLFICGN